MSKNLETQAFIDKCAKGHPLQGAVKYCPFCGMPVAIQQIQPTIQESAPASVPISSTASAGATLVEVTRASVVEQKSVNISSSVSAPKPELEQVPIPIPITPSREASERPVKVHSPAGLISLFRSVFKWLKYITVIILLLIFVGTAIIVYETKSVDSPQSVPLKSEASITPDAEAETAIRVAIQEMQLTGHSLFKEKQIRKSLDNAKEALTHSESYRETVNQLEVANTNTLRKTNEHLSAYLTQVAWLSRNSDRFSSAIRTYAATDQKNAFMVNLLKQHVTSFDLNKDMSEDAWKLELEPVSLQLGL